eukprot:763100-Hanusia_phi.AAC.23
MLFESSRRPVGTVITLSDIHSTGILYSCSRHGQTERGPRRSLPLDKCPEGRGERNNLCHNLLDHHLLFLRDFRSHDDDESDLRDLLHLCRIPSAVAPRPVTTAHRVKLVTLGHEVLRCIAHGTGAAFPILHWHAWRDLSLVITTLSALGACAVVSTPTPTQVLDSQKTRGGKEGAVPAVRVHGQRASTEAELLRGAGTTPHALPGIAPAALGEQLPLLQALRGPHAAVYHLAVVRHVAGSGYVLLLVRHRTGHAEAGPPVPAPNQELILGRTLFCLVRTLLTAPHTPRLTETRLVLRGTTNRARNAAAGGNSFASLIH